MNSPRWAVVLACASFAVVCTATAGASPVGSPVASEQEVVTLLAPHAVRQRPVSASSLVATVVDYRPATDMRTVLPVIGEAIDERGHSWLRVRLPGRTLDGATAPPSGWLLADHTRISATSWHVVVDVRRRTVSVYHWGSLVRRFRAVVGAASTPTPVGEWFIEESVMLPASAVGAPFALATSARSGVLRHFDGGPGQIAIHGIKNIGGRVGSATSHGCVRLQTRSLVWLAARVGAGVPFTVR